MAVRKQYNYGASRPISEKIMFGCSFCTLMVMIIILPMVIFSSLNPKLDMNWISAGTITLELISHLND
jgi:hypothetical protein